MVRLGVLAVIVVLVLLGELAVLGIQHRPHDGLLMHREGSESLTYVLRLLLLLLDEADDGKDERNDCTANSSHDDKELSATNGEVGDLGLNVGLELNENQFNALVGLIVGITDGDRHPPFVMQSHLSAVVILGVHGCTSAAADGTVRHGHRLFLQCIDNCLLNIYPYLSP
jgi:hypothetical protein